MIGFIVFMVGSAFYYGGQQYDAGYDAATNEHNKQVTNVANYMQGLMNGLKEESRKEIKKLTATADHQRTSDNERIRSLLAKNAEFKNYYNSRVHPDAVDLVYGPIRLQHTGN